MYEPLKTSWQIENEVKRLLAIFDSFIIPKDCSLYKSLTDNPHKFIHDNLVILWRYDSVNPEKAMMNLEKILELQQANDY